MVIFTNKIEFYPRHHKRGGKAKIIIREIKRVKKENKNNEIEEAILIRITVIALSN